MRLSVLDRFWSKVDTSGPGGCWLWTDALSHGYGLFWDGRRQVRAHRYAYAMRYGPIPDGAEVDHRCRNRACVSPDHLRLTTRKQNAENLSPTGRGESGVRGVSRNGKGWRAIVCHNYKNRYGTTRRTVEQAAADAVAMRAALFTHTQN